MTTTQIKDINDAMSFCSLELPENLKDCQRYKWLFNKTLEDLQTSNLPIEITEHFYWIMQSKLKKVEEIEENCRFAEAMLNISEEAFLKIIL